MSEKEVDVDCVISFYQKGKCGDNYVSKERARVKLKGKQDIAEVKREIRSVLEPFVFFACHFPLLLDFPYYLIGGRFRG